MLVYVILIFEVWEKG